MCVAGTSPQPVLLLFQPVKMGRTARGRKGRGTALATVDEGPKATTNAALAAMELTQTNAHAL